jgi:RNA polymerase sigma-70 factor (ECF subfamily)
VTDHEIPCDAELLQAWRDGDASAGEALFARHFESVFRFFRTKVDHGVDDLVHQTFLRCVESASRYRGEGSFRAFVLGIARHQLYNSYRKQRRECRALGRNFLSIEHIMRSPHSLLQAQERSDVVLAALRELPFDLQTALELLYWENLSHVEMAEILDVPVGTVKSRLHRARKQLLQALRQSESATP